MTVIRIKNEGVIDIGKNFIGNSGKRYNPIGGDINLSLIVHKNATLSIGNDVGISNSTIVCANRIDIHDNVFIGGSCKIWDTDFHSLDPIARKEGREIRTSPIKISKNVFIGGSSIILKGVAIGENSVIAAGSVLSKDVPSNQVWGGNPAKYIKNL